MSDAAVGEYKSNKVYPWVVVVALFICSFGSIGYTMASIGVYLPEQFVQLGVTGVMDLEAGPADLTWWITLYGFGMAFTLLFAKKIYDKFDARLVYGVGFAGQIIAVTLMSQYTALWQFYISGICIGLFGGMYYMVGGPIMVSRWFVKRGGFALGLVNAGTGAGGIINPLIIAAAIGGVKAGILDPLEQLGAWRTVQLIYGIVLLIVIVPTVVLLLRSYPSDKKMKPYGWTPEYEAELANQGANEKNMPGVSFKKAFKSAAFWCLFICAVAACFFGGFNNLYPTFVGDTAAGGWGLGAMFGALLVSLAGICNFVGPITGAVSDAIGAKKTTAIIIAMIGFGWVLFLIAGYVVDLRTEWFIIIATLFTSVQMIVVGVQLPLCAKEVFGLKDYEQIWATMMIGVGLLSSFAPPILTYPFGITGNYNGSFVIGIVIACIGLVTLLGMYGLGKKLQWEE